MQSRKLLTISGLILALAMVVAGPIVPIASASTLSITTASCPTGTQYASYAGCTIVVTGGTAPYKFSWSTNSSYGSLPEGLTLNPTTGAITGIVYGQGTYSVDFIVTDATGASTNKQIDMAVNGDSTLGGCSLFPSDSIFHTNISSLPVDKSPAAPIPSAYQSETIKPFFGSGSTGAGPNGIPFIRVPWNQPLSTVVTNQYQSYFTSAPIPSYAPVEGSSNSGGDQHVLVLQTAGNGNPCKLWEAWEAVNTGSTSWTVGSNAVWQNLSSYALTPLGGSNSTDPNGTTDAAGLPVTPLLVTYDEVASGVVTHPIRFTLNNMEHNYVWPATNGYAGVGSCAGVSTGDELSQSAPPSSCTTSGPAGEIYRLKASIPTPSQCANAPQALTIIQAFRNYGIILADNGASGGLIGTPDARWNDNQLSCLTNLTLSDFEPVNVSSLMVSATSAATKASGTTPTSTPVTPPDTTLPVTSITAPAAGTTLSGMVTVSASASDNVGVTSVALYVDGTLSSTDTSAPYSFSLNTSVLANGTHTLSTRAYDAAGNVGTSSNVTVTVSNTVVVTDTTPPSVPAGLVIKIITTSSISFSWTVSTDNVGVTGYNIYQNGTKIGTTNAASYIATGLAPSTAYSYAVSAYDAAGNSSAKSGSVTGTTNAVTVPTPTPTPTPTSTPTSSTPTGPAGYTFCSNEYATCSFGGTMSVAFGIGTSFNYLTLTNGTPCTVAVFGDPAVGADKACFIKPISADTVPPSNPTGLAVTGKTTSSISLSWTASTDNVGVLGYNIYRNGTKIGTSSAAMYTNGGLTALTSYSYAVSAYDAAGNVSGVSASVTGATNAVTTPTPTPTPTSTPTSTLPAGPQGYTFCSYEYGTCSFTGTMSVAFGASSLFTYQTLTNGTPCSVAAFGDPDVGVDKACFIAATTTITSPTPTPTPTSTPTFQINARIKTTAWVKVRKTPSLNSYWNVIGVQYPGAKGTVVGGPTTANGYVWWKINYDTGADGWSAENWLVAILAMNDETTTIAQQSAPQPVTAENPPEHTIAQMASILEQFKSLLDALQGTTYTSR